ncbi:OmpA family protein [Loktanella sp. S4079]|uniref:OmpA family protein n=1 Tax=Loktanella sp. S4079 TaxID=579483 RepID=UPI000696C6BE|nr:OmpA family protein [Loktanella sp. S4079]
MRAILVAAVGGATAVTFYVASVLTTSKVEAITADQVATQDSLSTEISALQSSNTTLEDEVGSLTQSLAFANEERDSLTAALDGAKSELQSIGATFEAQLAERDVALEDANIVIATLTETVETTEGALENANGQLTALQQGALSAATRIAELESGLRAAGEDAVIDVDERVSALEASLAERDTLIEELRAATQVAAETTETDGAADELRAEIAALTETIAERDAQIASFEDQSAETVEASAVNSEEIAALTADIAARDETIASLEGALETAAAETAEFAEAATEVESLTETVAARDATIAELEAQLAANAPAEDTADLDGQIADLTAQLAKQDQTIEMLRLGIGDDAMPADELAEVCMGWARGLLDSSQITFATGTTTISDSSVQTLERLRDLAIGCKNEGLMIEIGGHTDSQGGEAENQRLSEARAQAVLDYMVDLGVEASTMQAVGFGETNPVATNDTREGRAANRRITFEWKLHNVADETAQDEATDETTADSAEAETATVDE